MKKGTLLMTSELEDIFDAFKEQEERDVNISLFNYFDCYMYIGGGVYAKVIGGRCKENDWNGYKK